MGVDIERMISGRLIDMFGFVKCGEKVLQEVYFIQQSDESEWIRVGEYFCHLIFYPFLGYVFHEVCISFYAAPCLSVIVEELFGLEGILAVIVSEFDIENIGESQRSYDPQCIFIESLVRRSHRLDFFVDQILDSFVRIYNKSYTVGCFEGAFDLATCVRCHIFQIAQKIFLKCSFFEKFGDIIVILKNVEIQILDEDESIFLQGLDKFFSMHISCNFSIFFVG